MLPAMPSTSVIWVICYTFHHSDKLHFTSKNFHAPQKYYVLKQIMLQIVLCGLVLVIHHEFHQNPQKVAIQKVNISDHM